MNKKVNDQERRQQYIKTPEKSFDVFGFVKKIQFAFHLGPSIRGAQ
jgi:hypothetical protein